MIFNRKYKVSLSLSPFLNLLCDLMHNVATVFRLYLLVITSESLVWHTSGSLKAANYNVPGITHISDKICSITGISQISENISRHCFQLTKVKL